MHTNTPVKDVGGNRYIKACAKPDAEARPPARAAYPEMDERGASLLHKMLQRDPAVRPTADKLVQFLQPSSAIE